MNAPGTNLRPALAALAALLLSAGATGQAFASSPAGTRFASAALAAAPLYFEATPDSGFIARGLEYDVCLAPDSATLVLGERTAASPSFERGLRLPETRSASRIVRLALQGARAGKMTGLEPLPGKANYLVGDPAEWRTGVPLFAKVQVDEIYPGIRLIYYADQSGRLEYDFLLQPGARPEAISLRVEGADRVRVDSSGDLVLEIGGEQVRQHRPVIYQDVNGVRQLVRGGYRLTGRATAGFWLGNYDPARPLIIDPTLDFSSYLGGTKSENGWCIALDGIGNIYVAGETLSKGLPGTNGVVQPKYAGGIASFGDAFVAKFDSVSNQLVYLTYLGGKTDDGALGLAVDPAGNAYVTGFTDSKNFPIVPTNGVIRTNLSGNANNAFRIQPIDAFVTELDPTGSTIIFSTLLGGTRRDEGFGIAVKGADVYVAGYAESTNFFPIPNGFQTGRGGGVGDGFVVRLVGGTNTIYSTYLGGTNFDCIRAIDVDDAGNAYVTGYTFSKDFPRTNALVINGITCTNLNLQTNLSSGSDAFVSKISPLGDLLIYSSYLGGSNDDAGLSIDVDDAGSKAVVTGYTFSKVFPTNTFTAPQSVASNNFQSHVFVVAIGPDGGSNVLSTQFGSTGGDQGTGIAQDLSGTIYVTGIAGATNFFKTINTNLVDFTDFRSATTNSSGKRIKVTGPNDAFVAVLSADLSSFVGTNSILIGGSANDGANGIAVDPAGGFAVIVGTTASPNFRLTNGVPGGTLVHTNLGGAKNNKANDAFIGKILFP